MKNPKIGDRVAVYEWEPYKDRTTPEMHMRNCEDRLIGTVSKVNDANTGSFVVMDKGGKMAWYHNRQLVRLKPRAKKPEPRRVVREIWVTEWNDNEPLSYGCDSFYQTKEDLARKEWGTSFVEGKTGRAVCFREVLE